MEKSFLAIRKFAREQMRPFQKLTHSRCSATSGSQQSGRSTAVKKKMLLSFQCKIHIMIPIILVIYEELEVWLFLNVPQVLQVTVVEVKRTLIGPHKQAL